MNYNEPTAEEAELLQAATEGKSEPQIRRILVSFGGTTCTSPAKNGRLAMQTRDIWSSCEPIGIDECRAMDILTAVCILAEQAVKDVGDAEKKILMETLQDLALGDEKARHRFVGAMIAGALAPRSGLAYKVNVRERNE